MRSQRPDAKVPNMAFSDIEEKVLELWPKAEVTLYERRAGKHALRVKTPFGRVAFKKDAPHMHVCIRLSNMVSDNPLVLVKTIGRLNEYFCSPGYNKYFPVGFVRHSKWDRIPQGTPVGRNFPLTDEGMITMLSQQAFGSNLRLVRGDMVLRLGALEGRVSCSEGKFFFSEISQVVCPAPGARPLALMEELNLIFSHLYKVAK